MYFEWVELKYVCDCLKAENQPVFFQALTFSTIYSVYFGW